MALYEYQGQQYDIATDDPVAAKQKILSHLGKSTEVTTSTPTVAAPTPTPTAPKIDPLSIEAAKQTVRNLTGVAKNALAEGLSVANVIASAPEFIGSVAATPYFGAVSAIDNALEGRANIDWGKARETAKSVVSPLGAPARAIEPLARSMGLDKEFNNSIVNQGLETLTDGMTWLATESEKRTGIPKEGTMAVLETLMVTGVPGAKPAIRTAVAAVKKPFAAKPETPKTAKDIAMALANQTSHTELVKELDLPAMPKSNKEFSDALYTLSDKRKADETVVADIEIKLDKLGVSPELKEKFRRYTEETAQGNELINNQIDALKAQQKILHEDNARMYQEGDLRSQVNPNGTTLWKDLPGRDLILENRKAIKEIDLKIEETRAKYNNKEFLDPWEQRIYNETVGPQLGKITELNKYLHTEGIVPTINLDPSIVGGYTPRYAMFEDQGFLKALKDKISGDQFGIQQDFSTGVLPPAAKERALFVHELPNGQRNVIGFKGQDVIQWKNKEAKTYMAKPMDELKAGDKLGQGVIKEATLDEITQNTPFTYSKNLTAVTGTRLTELRDVARVNEFLKEWMESDHFKQNAHKITKGVDAPKGFIRPEHLDKMPQLNDYVFEHRTAEMLEDYNRSWSPNLLTEGSNALIKNMMLNPLPHMHNEMVHWYLARGATGLATPKGILDLARTMPEAIAEVYNRGPVFKEIMREGGSIMSANVRNNFLMEKAFKKGLDEVKTDPGFIKFAKAVGRSPLDLYDGISKQSNKAMWSARDILYVQMVLEKTRRGSSIKEAISSIERHMPSYRLPPRVGEGVVGAKLSRVVSKVLQNPNWVVFARYKHGMTSSFLNGVKDIAMLDPAVKKSKQFKEGLDYAVALSVLMGAIYPVMDSFFQAISDEDSAKVRRAGVTHLFSAIDDIASSKKDSFALLSALITFNPLAQAMAELAFDYELYNRRNIYNVEDDWDIIIDDIGNYSLRKVPQVSEGIRATSETGGGWKQWMMKQFDVKTQTPDQIEREETQIEKRQAAAENRRDER